MHSGEVAMPSSDEKWKIEQDARTVMESEAIKADKKRWPRVKKEIKKQVAVAQKELLEKKVAAKLLKAIPDG